ncbi:MAG: type I glutamate--ammonia ligase [Verrucomicrobiota bacterium]
MTPSEITTLIQDKGIKILDFKFCDILGTWQHFSTSVSDYDEEIFEAGLGFDGSSIRGWKSIEASDMLVVPDPATAWIDPFYEIPTLSFICSIKDPITHEPYHRDPRGIAQKAEAYLQSTGIADTCYVGPEPEFFVFDDVRYSYTAGGSFHQVDSEEAIWNTDANEEGGNLGYKVRHKGGYFPVPPHDTLQDVRSEMVLIMEELGIKVEAQHHEVATAGQCEIDMRFSPLLHMSDQVCIYKYVIRNVAKRYGKTVTFMPKPVFDDNGSGMHTHQSLWKGDTPLMAGDGYAGLSETALHYIGGILKHAPALIAFTNPTTNSFKRLVPGFEAPVSLVYSARNRSASVRIPTYSGSPKAKRIEFRTPDATATPYIAFSAMLMAGLDGIQNKIDPGDPMDKNLYDLPAEEMANIPQAPGSLEGALDALAGDCEFLFKGDVFDQDFVDNWIDIKRDECDSLRLRPHPYEFEMYYDV